MTAMPYQSDDAYRRRALNDLHVLMTTIGNVDGRDGQDDALASWRDSYASAPAAVQAGLAEVLAELRAVVDRRR
jgi:hypothetical protein